MRKHYLDIIGYERGSTMLHCRYCGEVIEDDTNFISNNGQAYQHEATCKSEFAEKVSLWYQITHKFYDCRSEDMKAYIELLTNE